MWEDYTCYSLPSDLWSLGCVLMFRCQGGRHLFFQEEAVVRWRGLRRGALPAPHHSTPPYSPALTALLGRLLGPRPADRAPAGWVLAQCTEDRLAGPRRKTT